MDDNMLLNLALDAGEIMLAAGAETHRVEDTMERILSMGRRKPSRSNYIFKCTNSKYSQSSFWLSYYVQEKHLLVALTFAKICRVNDLSRRFTAGEIPIEEAYQQLYTIYNEPLFSGFKYTFL